MRIWPWFVLAGVVAIAGLAAAGFYIYSEVEKFDAGLTRVAIPGSATVELDKAGTYTIFFEQQGAGEGLQVPSSLSVGLASQASGNALRLARASAETSYTLHDRRGISIYEIRLDQPGRYRLSASLAPGRNAAGASLAVGLSGFGSIVRTLGFAFTIIGTSLLLVAVIVAVALWRRSKARKGAQAVGATS